MKEQTSHESIDETLSMPLNRFVDRCKEWLDEFNGGKKLVLQGWMECPVAQYVILRGTRCGGDMVPNLAYCPICGAPVCPDCMNHNVEQISRVTGYLSNVGGWNENKKQELADRNRYNINTPDGPRRDVNR